MKVLAQRIYVLFLPAVIVLGTAVLAHAFGSNEQTPEEKAGDVEKKAIAKYNDGVKAMEAGRSIAKKGDSAYAYNYRATSDAKARKKYEEAIGRFSEALALKPSLAEADNNMGYCYRKLGKLDESLKAYDKALTLKTDFAQAHEYRGETYLALGQLEKAQADLSFLQQMKSAYADTLAKSIEVFQLEKIKVKALSGSK